MKSNWNWIQCEYRSRVYYSNTWWLLQHVLSKKNIKYSTEASVVPTYISTVCAMGIQRFLHQPHPRCKVQATIRFTFTVTELLYMFISVLQ